MKNGICAVLDYGKTLSKASNIVIGVTGIAGLCLLIVIDIIMGIVSALGYMNLSQDEVLTVILSNIVCLGMFAGIIGIWAYDVWLKKKIELWVRDGIVVNAVVNKVDITSPHYSPERVVLRFDCNGKTYAKLSTDNIMKRHRNKIFIENENRAVAIVYSPIFDVVMLKVDSL